MNCFEPVFSPSRRRSGILVLCMFAGLFPASLSAQAANGAALPVLSPQATISVLTMWPGSEIYIAFGHSSFRVRDDARNLDRTYNYGSFRMNDPLFVPWFVYGYMHYSLEAYPFGGYFRAVSRMENVPWYEQVLDLDQTETNRLFQYLENNTLETNKYYLYDFIKDNCATRLTDGLRSVLGSSFSLNPAKGNDYTETYRQQLDEHVDKRPVWQFLFYLVLGTASDQAVPMEEDDWLPQHLRILMENATVTRDGVTRPLVKQAGMIFDPPKPSNYDTPWINPALVLWPLAGLMILAFGRRMLQVRKGKELKAPGVGFRILDFLFLFILGLVGSIVWYLDFFSIHTAVKGNWNVIWLLPVYLVLAWFYLVKTTKAWVSILSLAAAVLTLLPLVLWPVWPQAMHHAMAALMLILASRLGTYVLRHWHSRRKAKST